MESGVALEPGADGGGLVGAAIVADQVDLEVFGYFAVDLCKDFLNSIARFRQCREPITVPSSTLKAAKVVRQIVVGAPLGCAGHCRSADWDQSRAWIWLFVRHEAPCYRAEVRGLRRRVVAAAW